jgi:Secretion system C-terminal sorting domain/FG-GAP-like repeat
MKQFSFLALLFCLCIYSVDAQNTDFKRFAIPVTSAGNTLKSPWAGGVNAPQISKADLNNDGKEDVLIFDRAGDVVITLRNQGGGQFVYDDALLASFPPLRSWALLRDYNRDGVPDLFTANYAYSINGVRVFKGKWNGNKLEFTPFLWHYPGCVSCQNEYVYYADVDMPGFWQNLIIAETDLPSVDDLDGDGDMDILTFDPNQGGNVSWIKNLSAERGFQDDSLQFTIADECYGRMYESGIAPCKCNLSGLPDTCVHFLQGVDPIRHPGSTVMTYDQDGDGDKELVLGDISFNCLNYLKNGGTKDAAWMVEQDSTFPNYSTTPVNLTSFPAAFYVDVDDDGKKDLLAAPNSRNITDDDNSIWYYRNTGSNTNHQFAFQSNQLWQDAMIDIGSFSHPALVDVNQDGLLDLVAGNFGFYTISNMVGNANNASLYLWLNVGTADNPRFQLESRNWVNFGQFAPDDYDFAPAFGDMDADGDLDLLVGSNGGILFYCQNTAGAGNPMQFTNPLAGYNYFLIDVGTASVPMIYDLDKDGKADMLIGERPGNINFFKNIGSATQPNFATTPTIQNIGAIDTRVFPSTVGYASPVLIPCATNPLLLTGNQIGELELYSGLKASSDSIPQLQIKWGNIRVGERSAPAIGDLNNDGVYDLVIGNFRGGFELYRTNLQTNCSTVAAEEPLAQAMRISVSPNPSSGAFAVETNSTSDVSWQVSDHLGRTLRNGKSTGHFELDITNAGSGVYFLQVAAGGQLFTEKLVVF